MKVILVEDYPDAQVSLQKLLELEGYAVDCAATKAAALERLHINKYDIGLIDLMLPDSQELEALDAIRTAAPDMPIVILSAIDDPSVAVEAIKRGASHYLKKPVEPDKLLDRMIVAMARP